MSDFYDDDQYNSSERPMYDMPVDLDAEREVLGALIQDGTMLATITDSIGILAVEEFASEKHRLIYRTILNLSTTTDNFSNTIINDVLERDGVLEKAGGRTYVNELNQYKNLNTSAIIETAKIIRNKARRRAMIEVADQIRDMCFVPDGRSVKEIFDESAGMVFKLAEESGQNDNGPQPAVKRAVELLVNLQEEITKEDHMSGVPTGFTELDNITQGLQPGSLNIIAARPSVGKTSFAMNIVANIAMNPTIHKPALVFSLEMPTDQILLRMLSTFGRVSMNNLKKGQVETHQWRDMVRKVKLLSEEDANGDRRDKLYIDDNGDITPLELRSRARKLYLENDGLSVIMIDYVQLMRSQTKAANRTLEIGEISRSLKMLAKELEVPIIALAQLNREVDNRKDHRPLNSDLRESGSLEQDADMIMFLHREAIYGKSEGGTDNSHQATLIIGKNRNGATADIELLFMGEYTAFYDKSLAEAAGIGDPGVDNNNFYAS